jgi:hypothetical protein
MPAAVGVGHAALDEQLGDGRSGDGADADPGAAAANRLEEERLVVGAEDEHRPGGRLLECLEEGVLSVRIESLGGGDDGQANAPLERQERELYDQRPGLVDADLPTGPGRRKPVHVGVVVVLDLAA